MGDFVAGAETFIEEISAESGLSVIAICLIAIIVAIVAYKVFKNVFSVVISIFVCFMIAVMLKYFGFF